MRWLRSLKARDIALDRSMIPLGSCTMKLNAAAEMEPITWPAFADLHPFAPVERSAGTRHGSSPTSSAGWPRSPATTRCRLQPNAGSQGELAGLLAIRGYHRASGDDRPRRVPDPVVGPRHQRRVRGDGRACGCVVVACDDDGNVDVDDLKRLVDRARRPTGGPDGHLPVDPRGVRDPASARSATSSTTTGARSTSTAPTSTRSSGSPGPGRFGADVSHLNLHKTFCIPHGGGGPGVGPVACRSHLAPYLPTHPLVPRSTVHGDVADEHRTGPVAVGTVGVGRDPADPVGLRAR